VLSVVDGINIMIIASFLVVGSTKVVVVVSVVCGINIMIVASFFVVGSTKVVVMCFLLYVELT